MINVIIILIIAVIAGMVIGLDKTIGVVLIGVAASLVAWTITSLFSKLIDISFDEHDRKTTRILDVVTGQYLSLEDVKRSGSKIGLLLKKYWATANKVKISGRALTRFEEEFFKNASHPLRVRVRKADNVQVRLLLLDPKSDAVTHLDSREPDSRSAIEDVLERITTFAPNDDGLRNGSSVEVRVTAEPLNTTLTAVTGSEAAESILLMGMLYNDLSGIESELFLVPDYVPPAGIAAETLHAHCIANFDMTFDKARKVFLWNTGGIQVFDDAEHGDGPMPN
jgi:hypothetical protein